jgi:hypothetical protein
VTVSHWFLDLIVHGPDLPLYPGSSGKLGFGLWNSVAGTVLVEGGLFVLCVWWYARGTQARDGIGRHAFRAFVGLLGAIYVANLAGPPPPSWQAVAYSALVLWLLPFWAEWFDRHRIPVTGQSA